VSAGIGYGESLRVAAVFAIGLAGGLLSNLLIKRWPPLALMLFGNRPPPKSSHQGPAAHAV